MSTKHTVTQSAAQGDVRFDRIDTIPEGVVKVARVKGEPVVVAHSETGHHHVIKSQSVLYFRAPDDSLTSYVQVVAKSADVEHLRAWDTHETLRLPKGTYRIRRQREYVPDGWRQVED